jgi:hypothetical protein
MQEPSEGSFCSAVIPMRLNQNVDDMAVLIHGTPQILVLPIDSDKDLIQIPLSSGHDIPIC